MSSNTVEHGWVVGIILPRGIFYRTVVGQVQAVDERGLRLSQLDALSGAFTGMDVFIPWRNVEYIEVPTAKQTPEDNFWVRWVEEVHAALQHEDAQDDTREVGRRQKAIRQ